MASAAALRISVDDNLDVLCRRVLSKPHAEIERMFLGLPMEAQEQFVRQIHAAHVYYQAHAAPSNVVRLVASNAPISDEREWVALWRAMTPEQQGRYRHLIECAVRPASP